MLLKKSGRTQPKVNQNLLLYFKKGVHNDSLPVSKSPSGFLNLYFLSDSHAMPVLMRFMGSSCPLSVVYVRLISSSICRNIKDLRKFWSSTVRSNTHFTWKQAICDGPTRHIRPALWIVVKGSTVVSWFVQILAQQLFIISWLDISSVVLVEVCQSIVHVHVTLPVFLQWDVVGLAMANDPLSAVTTYDVSTSAAIDLAHTVCVVNLDL